jgi:MSHA biogenesis protein MshP
MTFDELQRRVRLRRTRGLGVVAALLVLVMLSTLAAAIVRLTWTQQTTLAQDIDSARAAQAAYAGAQWGMYQALRGSWSTCAGLSQTLDLRSTMGSRVTVTCNSQTYNEGELADGSGAPQSVRIYTIAATACNGAAATCPDNASVSRPNYVERMRMVTVSDR